MSDQPAKVSAVLRQFNPAALITEYQTRWPGKKRLQAKLYWFYALNAGVGRWS